MPSLADACQPQPPHGRRLVLLWLYSGLPRSLLEWGNLPPICAFAVVSCCRKITSSKWRSASCNGSLSVSTFFFIFFVLTYSRWTSSLPSCLWSQKMFPSLPGSRLAIFYRDASSALLQLVKQWLNFTCSRSHAFRYERTQILLW